MAMLDVSYKRLCELIGKKLSIKKLCNALDELGFELDQQEGDALKLEVTHDRIDCLSPQGMARAIRSVIGIDKGLKEYPVKKSQYSFIIHDSIRKIRPYAVSCIIKNLHFTDKLIKDVIWVQEKLHLTFGRDRRKAAIGIYPLKDLNPPIHFKAEKPEKIRFVPLEFNKEVNANEILRMHPTGQKYAKLLEEHKKYPVLMDSKGNILSMPPIINSKTFGKVTEETTEIFIEVTGTDWVTVNQVLTILATMFAEEGGIIYQMNVKYKNETFVTPRMKPEKWTIKKDYVNKMLGVNFTDKEISKLLNKMGMNVKSVKDKLEILVPFFRADVLHAVDIVDDVARAYGFNNFEPELPKHPTIGGLLPRTTFNNRVRELMIGHGLLEVFTLALTTPEDQFKKMNKEEKPHISVMQPRCKESILRTSLLPELMKSFESNLHRDYPQKIFEVNDVVFPDSKSDIKAKNETRLACAVCSEKANFTEAKQYLESFELNLGVKLELEEKDYESFIPGRSAKITYKGKEVGKIGEMHPKVINNFGLKLPVSCFEISLEKFY